MTITLKSVLRAGFIAGCLSAMTLAPAVAATAIKVETSELSPYSVKDNSEKPGIAIELMAEISKRTGIEFEFGFSPWKRAQKLAHETPNTIVLPPARTAAREEKYNWIAPIATLEFEFVTADGTTINSFDEARALPKIAVLSDSAMMQILTKQGFENLHAVNDSVLAAKMLNGGRVSAWFDGADMARATLANNGINPEGLTFGKPVLSLPLWIATNLTFDAATADAIRTSVEELIADGTRDRILHSYTH